VTLRTFTTPSAICFTSPALAPAIIYS
jgi:hypothetical protein